MARGESNVASKINPAVVTWIDKYGETLDNAWVKLPRFLRNFIATVAIFILGVSVNGDWINIGVHLAKQLGFLGHTNSSKTASFKWSDISPSSEYMKDWQQFVLGSVCVSFGLYIGVGGFLHWYFYVQKRDRPEEWKIQPKKFPTPEIERLSILVGGGNLMLMSLASGLLSCYFANGGATYLYYTFNDDYPWWWFFLQIPIIFLYQDYATYWIHRLYHTPFLYKHFHKIHHKYTQPTAFTVTAIHPVESFHIQVTGLLPIFVMPVHWFAFYMVVMYAYYHGIIDHSGINFKAYWWQPWQPDALFHDNHHQYFHVNYGFNIGLWDKIHGTERRKDRIYTEDLYWGGKDVAKATSKELQADIEERLSENPAAYRNNELIYAFTDKDLNQYNNNEDKKTS